jgi:hypothetical protein
MQELISRLTEKAGINADQATKAIDTIKDFVKEKFPMMAGAVDNLFAAQGGETMAAAAPATPVTPVAAAAAAAAAVPAPAAEAPKEEGHSMLDKISDVIPGQAGEKVEDFIKGAADKAEDLFDAAKDKLSGLFGGGDKK